MIDELRFSSQLLANIPNKEATREFLYEVINEYLVGKASPMQANHIDGKLLQRRLERMIEGAIVEKNPTFDHSIVLNIEWGLRTSCGFSCRIIIGISDFDLAPFGHSAVEVSPLWQ